MIDSSWSDGKPRGLVDLRDQVDLVQRDGVPLERFAIDVGIEPLVMTALAKLSMAEVCAIQTELEYLDVPSARVRRLESAQRARHTDDRVMIHVMGRYFGAGNGNGRRKN
jgi:hypothetical protein